MVGSAIRGAQMPPNSLPPPARLFARLDRQVFFGRALTGGVEMVGILAMVAPGVLSKRRGDLETGRGRGQKCLARNVTTATNPRSGAASLCRQEKYLYSGAIMAASCRFGARGCIPAAGGTTTALVEAVAGKCCSVVLNRQRKPDPQVTIDLALARGSGGGSRGVAASTDFSSYNCQILERGFGGGAASFMALHRTKTRQYLYCFI
jgi:hypothetical protein